ncbi:MAG: hypothetical protein HYT62_01885 [Candidatus Yanofskybacteria bacterium]|nr:hypothetical protein [Candidatus Yanofskybacteria bacterium]
MAQKDFKKFGGFEEFGRADKQERAQNLKQQIDDIFEKSVKDDFDSIPEGPFKSSLPEISWIAFARPTDRKTGERNANTLNAVIFSKNESGKNVNHTWTVNRNGTIKPIQPIPSELAKKYSQEEITLEIAGLLERIGPSFIHLTDLDIIPAQDKVSEKENSVVDGGGIEGGEKVIDPERLEFFRSLKDAKFISANRSKGLKGYMVVFFNDRDFIVIENPYKGNAAFILDLPEKVDMEAIEEEIRVKKSKEGESVKVSKEELRDEVEKRYWQPISEKAKTRSDLKALGAERIVHTPATWQENISKAIASRIK